MSTRREIFTGIVAAVISIVILAGSIMVATVETESTVAKVETNTPTLTSMPTRIILVTQRPGEPTYTPSPTPLPSQTPTTEKAVSCPQPPGWTSIIVQPGDTLDNLAKIYTTTPEALAQANCLFNNNLVPGTVIYVPGPPPPTPVPCGPPPGWVYYIVQSGDTLYSISRKFGTTVYQLQVANCLGSSTNIRVGQKLYVPNVPPQLPSSTPTLSATPSPQPSATLTVAPPSPTPTNPVPTTALPSVTPGIPTDTPVPSSATPTETYTPTPTSTVTPDPPTSTPTNTSTSTSQPTNTPVPSVTPSATIIVIPTNTPTP